MGRIPKRSISHRNNRAGACPVGRLGQHHRQAGLALLLIGKTDEDGFLTASRTLITAAYPPEQELGRMGELIGMVAEPIVAPSSDIQTRVTLTPIPLRGLNVQIGSTTKQRGQITTWLRLYNGTSMSIPITPDDIWLALGYVEDPVVLRVPADGLEPFVLMPSQAADIALLSPWQCEPYGILGLAAISSR